MQSTLTDLEWARMRRIPELDLVQLAVEVDILVPAEIDHRSLLARCIERVIERARDEGLPFSKYDREDLEELPPAHRAAIARLQGLPHTASVDDILRVGAKVYRLYESRSPGSAVALLLPTMLGAVGRIALAKDP